VRIGRDEATEPWPRRPRSSAGRVRGATREGRTPPREPLQDPDVLDGGRPLLRSPSRQW